ncbi:TIR-like protein FxsC [Micromonospora sp. CPCC 205539]|uniref:TIR-like protein FxsC n=1 Tax=Micromonospora sp. CPCC 205539 TaxID=3122408 RepID=UPI002FF0D6CB
MTWTDIPSTHGAGGPETYFFLSYAHSVPLSDAARPDTDYWVSRFFQELAVAVRRRATRAGEIEVGFFDGQVSLGADLKQALTDALSVAHVFVPLYSPNYFRNAWALGERDSFLSRLARLTAARAARHVLPVLWMPLPSRGDQQAATLALQVVPDEDTRADYAENGLRALCKLSAYRRQYDTVLTSLADRIVTVAEAEPLAPSRAATLTTSPVVDDDDPALVLTTLTEAAAPWRPYGHQHELAVADYVAATAERLGLPTRVVDLVEARGRAPSSPMVVLVDAGVGAHLVGDALDGLPQWVVPLVIAPDHPRGDPTPEAIAATLQDAEFPQVLPVRTIEEFERCAPLLVTEARKQFLRHGPVSPPDGPHDRRPRLGPTAAFNAPRGKETP